jgi:hypothetical protein
MPLQKHAAPVPGLADLPDESQYTLGWLWPVCTYFKVSRQSQAGPSNYSPKCVFRSPTFVLRYVSACCYHLFLSKTATGTQELGYSKGRVLFATWYSLYVQLRVRSRVRRTVWSHPSPYSARAFCISPFRIQRRQNLSFLFFFLVHSERKVDRDEQGGSSSCFMPILCDERKGHCLVQEKGRGWQAKFHVQVLQDPAGSTRFRPGKDETMRSQGSS